MELMVRTLGTESEGRTQRHAFLGGFTVFFVLFFIVIAVGAGACLGLGTRSRVVS